MQKWEYMTVRADHDRDEIITSSSGKRIGVSNWLDGRGGDGWELVSAVSCSDRVDQVRLYFKRKVETAT